MSDDKEYYEGDPGDEHDSNDIVFFSITGFSEKMHWYSRSAYYRYLDAFGLRRATIK